MNTRGLALFATVFAVTLSGLAGYTVLRFARPPVSAAPPVTPEVRQFDLWLHVLEAGETTVRHWVPPTLVVNAGDTVILRLHNGDPEAAHGFVVGALNLTVPPIPPGDTVTVRFVARRPGIYHFGCGAAGCAADHAAQIGQLVVLRASP